MWRPRRAVVLSLVFPIFLVSACITDSELQPDPVVINQADGESTSETGRRDAGTSYPDAPRKFDTGTAKYDTGHGTMQCMPSQCGANAHCQGTQCVCDSGYERSGSMCVKESSPCDGVTCSGHGNCQVQNGSAVCNCDQGYEPKGKNCVSQSAGPCGGITCSGHGTCKNHDGTPVCACDSGYTPSTRKGLDCVPTSQVCKGGSINYDYNNDGNKETMFKPSQSECKMFELVNLERATHDPMGSPECHKPLMYNVKWSAHARHHSREMAKKGGLFHADSPGGQNVASCQTSCAMRLYMTGPNEPHCPKLSHHCNIMRCRFREIGIGDYGGRNTQNFL